MRNSLEKHQITGAGLCPEDQQKYDDGFIALVGVDPEKSHGAGKTLKMENAHRDGNIVHVKMSVWDEIFDSPLPINSDNKPLPLVFVDGKVIDMLIDRVEPKEPEIH